MIQWPDEFDLDVRVAFLGMAVVVAEDVQMARQPIGTGAGQTCDNRFTCPTCQTACHQDSCVGTQCDTCPPTCASTCQTCNTNCNQNTCVNTCQTCNTNCGQDTCANTCQTCNTQCNQNTCAGTCQTCNTQCNQNTCATTCQTCRTDCNQNTCDCPQTCHGYRLQQLHACAMRDREHQLCDALRDNCWRPALGGEQARAAVGIAREVATRLRWRQQVDAAAMRAQRQTAFPESINWRPYSIAQGYAGLALMAEYVDRCCAGEGWDDVARYYLELAAWGAEGEPQASLSLFAGLAGLGYTAHYLSRGTRYSKLVAAIDAALLPRVATLAEEVDATSDGLSVSNFDVISGLAGAAAYLLCRANDATSEAAAAALRSVVDCLVRLVLAQGTLPRWYTPPGLYGDPKMVVSYPHGQLNCGLAHGIPGPLALLALAHRQGVEVEGLHEAVERTADWLTANRFDDEWGVNWPTAVPVEVITSGTTPMLTLLRKAPAPATTSPNGPSRTAWCYGSPGVARALWLAGDALGRDDLQTLAVSAMEAVYQRPLAARQIDSPTFCHGVAGLLHITLRFAHDTALPLFQGRGCGAGRPICLGSTGPKWPSATTAWNTPASACDQPGLLDGVPGVAMVLLRGCDRRRARVGSPVPACVRSAPK